MSSRSEALGRWQSLLNLFQQEQVFRPALTGDGSGAGTADVPSKPGWAWVRYDEKLDHASQVVNWRFPGIGQGVPVMVGKQYPTDRYYQILGVNLDLYLNNMTPGALTEYILPNHGNSHLGSTGNDPAPIDLRNFIFGRVSANSPESLLVSVSTFRYSSGGAVQAYAGEVIDLTAELPGGAGEHAYCLVWIDPVTNAADYVTGASTPVAMAPDIPDVVGGTIPLALVRLENGVTEIYESDIYDYRGVFNVVGKTITTITADYTATIGDSCILVDASIDPVTVTLPPVDGLDSKEYTIKKIDVTENAVTVDADGVEEIDHAETAVMTDPLTSIDLISDGSSWWVT